jgi:hypothetical protein
MRRPFSIVMTLLLIAAGVAIGIGAYNAGYTHGVEANGKAVEVVRTVGPGWGFFPGFFIFPLIVLILFATRGFRHRHWDGHDRWNRLERHSTEWHRAQHENDRNAPTTT